MQRSSGLQMTAMALFVALVVLSSSMGADARLLRGGPSSTVSPDALLAVEGGLVGHFRGLLKKDREDAEAYRSLPEPRKVQTSTLRSGAQSYGYASAMPATKMNGPIMDSWLAAGSVGGQIRAASVQFGGSYAIQASPYMYGSYRGL